MRGIGRVLAVLGFLTIAGLAIPAWAQKRVALVVGNSAYQHTPALMNPRNDAADMAGVLRNVGFEVLAASDLGKRDFDAIVRQFAGTLSGAEAGVFFYSGHGLQVAGQNYLVPVDARLEDASGLDFELVRLDMVHRIMERETSTNVLFIDAARDNPLALNLARAMGTRAPTIERGLAPMASGVGTLLSFSNQPGHTAMDGTGRNSPFAGALIRHIARDGEDLTSILISVRNEVMQTTQRTQIPWEHSALTGRFYFKPPSAPSSGQTSSSEAERAWAVVRETNDIRVLEMFRDRYKGTPFGEMAAARLEELKRSEELKRREAEERRPAYREEPAPCPGSSICTAVSVFFGTDRKQDDVVDQVRFGPDRADKLQLGRAIVTVPRAPRQRGKVIRPGWLEQWVYRAPGSGDPARHFTIPTDGVILFANESAFLAAARRHVLEAGEFKEHALVFVHGYRVGFEDALFRTAQITYDLGTEDGPFGTAFLYSWPSSGELRGYKYDFDSARFAVDHLRTFLEMVIGKSGAKYVHLIGHSMGSWPLLAAIDQLAKKTAKPTTVINQVILAAPDIDAGEFLKMAEGITRVAKGVTLYASSTDYAMMAAREIHRGAPRAGDIPKNRGPVVVKGIDTIDVSALSTDVFSMGHAGYADRKELLNDISLLLRKGERPPHLRMPILERVRLKNEIYWKYPN